MNNSGFTMIELIITIAIIVTLSSVAVPLYGDIVVGAKSGADDASIIVLNDATTAYAMLKGLEPDEVFAGIESDAARMKKLVDEDYLIREVEPQQKDSSFNWDKAQVKWVKNTVNDESDNASGGYNTPNSNPKPTAKPTPSPSGETGGEPTDEVSAKPTPKPTEKPDYLIYGYGIKYDAGVKVLYDGELYVSHKSTKKVPGQHKDWQKVSDEWFKYNTYSKGDVIYYDGAQYRAKKGSLGKSPENKKSHWEKIS
jgi:prepilin-type N-terminal cleavage/methylation domain-containing protein